jgi:hypothetical protein
VSAARAWAAEVVDLSLMLLCLFTGHARGCWVLNSAPVLSRLFRWANDVQYRARATDDRHRCAYCSGRIPRPANVVACDPTPAITYSGASGTITHFVVRGCP